MTNEVVTTGTETMLERVIVGGDLSKLTPGQRTEYYRAVCESLGLNPLTRPFEYIELDGKLTLYTRKDATDQLRANNKINVTIISRERMGDVYIVTVRATTADGRSDESTGVVSLVKEGGEWRTAPSGKRYFAGNGEWTELRGNDMANQLMRAETKAKRRVTLSICGLGWTDESEIETIPNARPVVVHEDGVIDEPTTEQPTTSPRRWVEDDESLARFWAWTDGLGLTHKEVQEACGVRDIKEYKGDKSSAIRSIRAYIAAHADERMAAEAHTDSILDRGDV